MYNKVISSAGPTIGSSTEILKDIRPLDPVSEAVEPSLPNMFSPFICNDFSSLFNNHKFGNGRDVVFLLQLTAKKRKS